MKAMMIKDFNLLKGQKQFFGAIVIILILFTVVQDNPSFCISYVTIMFSILTITTMSYDDYENGMCYLMTMPIRRRDYVVEKYIFGIAASIFGFVGASVFAVLSSYLKGDGFPWEEWKGIAAACIFLMMAVLAVTTPIQLKFGSEKSRMAIMGVYGVGCLCVYGAVKAAEACKIDIDRIIESAFVNNLTTTIWGITIASMMLLGISCLISVYILEKREF